MVGCGIDLVEVPRIAKSMENPSFLRHTFSQEERTLFLDRKNNPQVVAGNFAAKEAFGKALGTGIRGFSWHEVALLRGKQGEPYLKLDGRAAMIAKERNLTFVVSLSNTAEYATAIVIAVEKEGKTCIF